MIFPRQGKWPKLVQSSYIVFQKETLFSNKKNIFALKSPSWHRFVNCVFLASVPNSARKLHRHRQQQRFASTHCLVLFAFLTSKRIYFNELISLMAFLSLDRLLKLWSNWVARLFQCSDPSLYLASYRTQDSFASYVSLMFGFTAKPFYRSFLEFFRQVVSTKVRYCERLCSWRLMAHSSLNKFNYIIIKHINFFKHK